MSHNRDLSAAAAQLGFHSSNIGIGSEAPRYGLDVYNSNLLVSGPSAGNIILEDRSVSNSSRPFALLASNDGNFTITSANRNVSGTTTSSAERLRITSSGNVGINSASPSHRLEVAYNDDDDGFVINNINRGGKWKFATSGTNAQSFDLQRYDGGNSTFRRYLLIGTSQFAVYTGSTTSSTERLRITSSGNVGINATSPERKLEVVDTAGSLTYPVAVSNFTDASAGVGAGIDFRLTASGNTRGELGCKWTSNSSSNGTCLYFSSNDGSTGNIERLRITYDGKFGFNTTNPGAFDSGANHLVLLGNTSGTGNAGITISSGTDSYGNIYFADGTNGADAYRGHIAYNHNGDTMRFATNGSEKVRILSSGFVNIGSGYLTNSNSGLHVARSSGGTAAGESVLAATLGNGSTMNNAIFTVKNAGDRGSQGHGSGSPLAKFEFNNGTAFEIDKSGRRTLQYQPAFNAKLSTATGNNFNGMLVFNTADYNIGGHYSTSNGRFTAPVAGRYLFNFYTNVIRDGGTGALWADWYVNNSGKGYRMYTQYDGGWELIGGSIVLSLSQNDYVQVYTGTPGRWDGGSYGSFNGYMLG
jgi:hypothetical protein